MTPHDSGRGTYNVIVHRVVSHAELVPSSASSSSETKFGCELTIPGTDYVVREESVYAHHGFTGGGGSRGECMCAWCCN